MSLADWLTVTAIYLTGSLITGKWGASWIIWPVVGVLFSVGYSIVKYNNAEKRAR